MVVYESEGEVTSKINLLVQYSSRIFQLIVMNDNDTSYVPNFEFPYILVDCKTNQNLTRGLEWEKFLESDIPVIFTNTQYMFEQFERENQELNKKEASGAALFAQGFYYVYRDRFWEDNKAKLIFMVTEKYIKDMWNYVNAGFTIELIPYYMRKNQKNNFSENTEQSSGGQYTLVKTSEKK